jgi:D-alanine-D-alanine ligase
LSKTVLIEKEIKGVETEIAVLETNGEIKLGKIGQIRYIGEFYDYEAKYKSYNTELIIPAEITDEQKTAIREYALRIFKAIGGRGLSRVDFFVDGDNVIFNEINTMPGFTSGSMYPLLMTGEKENISDLIDSILMNEI